MSANTDADGVVAGQYRTLADRVKDAEQPDVWGAFGEEMNTLARKGRGDHAVAGFVIHVSRDLIGTGADLDQIIGVGYRQFGSNSDSLQRNDMAKDAEVYAVSEVDPNNPLEAARQSVVGALQNAAKGGRSPEDGE